MSYEVSVLSWRWLLRRVFLMFSTVLKIVTVKWFTVGGKLDRNLLNVQGQVVPLWIKLQMWSLKINKNALCKYGTSPLPPAQPLPLTLWASSLRGALRGVALQVGLQASWFAAEACRSSSEVFTSLHTKSSLNLHCAAPRVVTFKHGATRFHKAVYWPNYKLDILLNFTREL